MKKYFKSILCFIIAAMLVMTASSGVSSHEKPDEISLCDMDFILVSQ